jgi:hypothetical protein
MHRLTSIVEEKDLIAAKELNSLIDAKTHPGVNTDEDNVHQGVNHDNSKLHSVPISHTALV